MNIFTYYLIRFITGNEIASADKFARVLFGKTVPDSTLDISSKQHAIFIIIYLMFKVKL